jgi:hypothetical protein
MKETDEGVQMNDVNESQEGKPTIQGENVDYKALYLDEVQNAKKLRKRAQDAETTVQETVKDRETQKVKQMKEQEKYKELYESVAPFKEKWEAHESTRREKLLSKLPEEDRESLSQKDLDTLEYIVSIKEESKPVNPSHTPAQSRNIKSDIEGKDWTKMDDRDRRENWDDVVNSYKNKN